MGAPGTDGLDRPGSVEQQDFGIEPLHLDFLLLARLQRERANAFELVFLCHVV